MAQGSPRAHERHRNLDPTANWEEQIKLSVEIQKLGDMDTTGMSPERIDAIQTAMLEKALRLSELTEALHTWIERGGFLPAQLVIAERGLKRWTTKT